MDPAAGNSVVTYLNKNLRNDAKDQIEEMIEHNMRARSKQRRRRDLAGDKAINQEEIPFDRVGSLGEVD